MCFLMLFREVPAPSGLRCAIASVSAYADETVCADVEQRRSELVPTHLIESIKIKLQYIWYYVSCRAPEGIR